MREIQSQLGLASTDASVSSILDEAVAELGLTEEAAKGEWSVQEKATQAAMELGIELEDS